MEESLALLLGRVAAARAWVGALRPYTTIRHDRAMGAAEAIVARADHAKMRASHRVCGLLLHSSVLRTPGAPPPVLHLYHRRGSRRELRQHHQRAKCMPKATCKRGLGNGQKRRWDRYRRDPRPLRTAVRIEGFHLLRRGRPMAESNARAPGGGPPACSHASALPNRVHKATLSTQGVWTAMAMSCAL